MSWLAAAAVIAPAPAAFAQAAPAAKAPPAKTVEGVTVTGQSTNGYRSSIDRRSYGVASDLQATTGSIGDALRSIPSVEVDVQGNVSLRGDSNVTIMIDGKPSGMFRGDGRAAALQQLAADQIERVEVITNPSAAFNPEGTGGIINLITKQTRKPGKSGSVRANLGSESRDNAGVSGAYNSNKLTLSGDASVRHDPQKFSSIERRELLDPSSGKLLPSLDKSLSRGRGHIWTARASVDYDLDKATRISGELRRNQAGVAMRGFEHYNADDASGAPTQIYDRLGETNYSRSNTEASASYRRKFTGEDHELVANLRLEQTDNDVKRRYANSMALPAAPDVFEDNRTSSRLTESQLKVDYTRPMPDQAKLKSGYDLQVDDNDYDNFGARGPSLGATVADPSMTNHFIYRQAIHAVYGTYERPFGDFTALAGLRLEEVLIDTNQMTSALKDKNDYFRAYPSLHLAYKLSDAQQVTASYSRRVQRPGALDLNPYRAYQSPLNYLQGNPRLRPQQTDSFEAGYQYRRNGNYYLATVYYRESHDVVTDVVRDLGGGVLLSRKENLGQSRSGGVELVANGKLTKTLSYNISGNAYWNEIDAGNLGFSGSRSGVSLGGRANLNWQATPKDFFQVNGFLMGKRLLPQGYRAGTGMLNLGYRHKFSDDLSGVVTFQDVLDSLRQRVVIDTPALHDQTEFRGDIRGVFIGLTYSFGGGAKRPRDPGFDFGGGGPP